MQLTGLNGPLTDISDYFIYDECGWINPNKFSREKMPYWLRGFADLAFVTRDLNPQQSDGWFGPNILRKSLQDQPDLWSAILLINGFRLYYEYSNDDRVIKCLVNYFQYVNKQSNEIFQRE
ncbi:unnamed protein product [Rotaria sp. Silwood2]|nr:unnamed protein product [Rotaria sp. Silwood2]CAF4507844.1 unnamed protein product [Rotaria sp. Silwood2]